MLLIRVEMELQKPMVKKVVRRARVSFVRGWLKPILTARFDLLWTKVVKVLVSK